MQLGRSSVPHNHTSYWTYLSILVVVLLAFIYALPNWFGESPSVQVSLKEGGTISPEVVTQVEKILSNQNLTANIVASADILQVRLPDTVTQMKVQDALQSSLGDHYTVAMNLAPNTPSWLAALGANPMKLGLDLRGGMYFLLDTDLQSVIDNTLQSQAMELRTQLRDAGIRYSGITLKQGKIFLEFRSEDAVVAAKNYLNKNYPTLDLVISAQTIQATLSPVEVQTLSEYAIDQTVQVMRNRVNQLGVAEASVAKQGTDRIVIELPGVQDATRAKSVIGGTATLKVMLVDEQASPQAALAGSLPIGDTLYRQSDGSPVVLKDAVVLTGKSIVGASVGYDPQTNLPVVNVRLSGPEVSHFSQVTADNIGHLMAIVLVEQSFEKKAIQDKVVTQTHTQQSVISVATIQSQLGNNFQITGIGNMRSAQNLALLIRAGALPAPVQIVEEKQIGPTLGIQNIHMGAISVCVAMLLVMLFMGLYYRLFGWVANLALLLNLILIIAVMSILPGATLTLPGIAGIVLNVGMAIDGNVLIFERIREELRQSVPPQTAIYTGYDRAFSTIVDSNITTLIVALILFAVGTGPIKGFAVTLMIGIVTSMFTAIVVTRALINWIYGHRTVKKLSIGIH